MKAYLRAIFLLIGFFVLTGPALAKSASGPAPDFTLKSKSGTNLRLSEYRGQVVMINFWASWCGPCRQEMPLLEDMYKRYAKLGFTILGVNVDNDPGKANNYLNDVKVSFPILYDTSSSVSKLYNVSAMPTTVLVDKNGNMRFLHMGYKPGYEKDYVKQIKQLIRE